MLPPECEEGAMADERKIPGFDPARLEREVDDEAEMTATEIVVSGPEGEGAEILDEREVHAEPPPGERGYRNLNE